MSSGFVTLAPELEEILRVVGSDPDSNLLRVPRPRRIRSLFDRESPPSETGLSSAERHLLRVHRHELAWILRQLCIARLIDGPESRDFESRHITADRSVALPGPHELRDRADCGCVPVEGADCAASRRLIEAVVRDPLGGTPTVGELASTSFALEATDEARVLIAIELAQGAGPRSALLVLGELLSRNPDRSVAASAWTHVGLAHAKLGNFAPALEAYRTLCRLDEEVLFGWIGAVLMSLQLGDEASALEAAAGLDERAGAGSIAVAEWTEALTRRRARSEWKPTPAAPALVTRIAGRLGDPSRRLAHALV